MNRKGLIGCTIISLLTVSIISTSCSRLPPVTAQDLDAITSRDAVAFDVKSVPDEVLDRLGSHRVVVLGENHFLREHREFVVELLKGLHERGFRQLLFEWTQAADWLLDDFVMGGGLEPAWVPPLDIGGDMISAIRDFNRTLPESERIRVRPIDITLQDYGGSQSFLWSLGALTRHLSDPGPLTGFLQSGYGTVESGTDSLSALQEQLRTRRSDLISSWGASWYNTVAEMVEVELTSVTIRSIRDKNYDESVRMREEAIKLLVDRRLADSTSGAVINIGSTHAQKERLWGTKIEWLGDYLAHTSQAAGSSVIVIEVSAARIESSPESGIPDFDLGGSPNNELFLAMQRISQDQIVFLPADDPVFSTGGVPINNAGDIYTGSPKRYFDAFVLLPMAHRIQTGQ